MRSALSETSVRVFAEAGVRKVEFKPIAGTRPRGESGDGDDRLERDAARREGDCRTYMLGSRPNDVARVSAVGTSGRKALSVERYARACIWFRRSCRLKEDRDVVR